jgi:hypothetical protein
MTKKVGRDTLKKLIEGVLSEDLALDLKSGDANFKHSLGGPEDRVEKAEEVPELFGKLSAIKSPDNQLDKDDIEYFIDVPEEEKLERYGKFDTNIERAMYLTMALPDIYFNLVNKLFNTTLWSKPTWKRNLGIESEAKAKATEASLFDVGALGIAKNIKISGNTGAVNLSAYLSDIIQLLEIFSDFPSMKELAELASKAKNQFYEFQKMVSKEAEQTMTSPTIDSAKAERGEFPESQKAMIKKLLTGKTFGERMKQVNEISLKYREASKVSKSEDVAKHIGTDPSKILTEIMLLDLFNLLLRATTAEQARYGFEALLALIAGGSQEGATRTSAGTQGVADFVDDQGNPGSAKLYKSGTAKIDQSLTNFEEAAKNSGKEDFQLHYVIGLKKQGAEQLGTAGLGRGTGTPTKTVVLEIHEPIFGLDSEGLYVIPSGTTKKLRQSGTLKIKDGGRILLHTSLPLGEATGEIYVTSSRVETFKSYIGTTIEKLGGEAEKMLNFFKAFIQSMEDSKEKSKTYIASNNPKDAQDTLGSLDDSKRNFNEIQEIMDRFYAEQDPYGPQDGVSYGLDESKKITSSMLKKIIEEKFKK